jgi:hypothetical protein
MNSRSAALHTLCAIVFVACAAPANAQKHSIRIDQGNGSGCMSTYTTISDPTGVASISPGGTFENAVACTPDSSSPSDLFPESSPNDASGAIGGGASYLATGGEMFQFYAGAISADPTAQVVEWTLANSDTEIEMNQWCSQGATGSFTFGGATYTGGCGSGQATDFLFSASKAFIGYANDSTGTLDLTSAVPAGWTTTGGGTGTVTAPEIDPASAFAALTLLAGTLVVLSDRRQLRVRTHAG